MDLAETAATKVILHRLWPFLIMATVTVWIGVAALTRLNPALFTALLGVLLVTYSLLNLGGIRLTISARHEAWAGPLLGSANGVLTGMTGSFVVPGVIFLQAIGLSRDVLVQAMGMLFTASTLALATALQQADFLTVDHGVLSASAVLPAIVGMIGAKDSQASFRTTLSDSLLRRFAGAGRLHHCQRPSSAHMTPRVFIKEICLNGYRGQPRTQGERESTSCKE